jgi:membrane-associated phospholipid phosphatase
MSKGLILVAISFMISFSSFGQSDTLTVKMSDSLPKQSFNSVPVPTTTALSNNGRLYKLKPAVDIPVTAIGMGWSLYAFTKIYSKDPSTQAQILSLNVEDINGFDRWAADIYSKKADDNSYIPFYISMPLPLVMLADKEVRKDALKVYFMYLEAMSVTGLLYTGSTYFTNRYRPYAYNPNVPMSTRMRGGAKNSFFAGHVALVATSTFFMAKIHSDYHPGSKINWLYYAIAAGATGTTAYLRHRGGNHFPSDILLGTAVGTLSGILVPNCHKNKMFKNDKLSIIPFAGENNGLALVYKL